MARGSQPGPLPGVRGEACLCFSALALAVSTEAPGPVQRGVLWNRVLNTRSLGPGALRWTISHGICCVCTEVHSRARFTVPTSRKIGGFLSTTRCYFQILEKDIFRVTNFCICSTPILRTRRSLKGSIIRSLSLTNLFCHWLVSGAAMKASCVSPQTENVRC